MRPPPLRAPPGGYPKLDISRVEFADLLRDGEFRTLEARLAELQEMTEGDIRWEAHLDEAYWSFYRGDPDFETHLNRWVDASPDAPEARFARSVYLVARARRSRGGKYAADTPRKAFQTMNELLERAYHELEAGRRLEPNSLIGHLVLLDILQPFGWSEALEAALAEGLAGYPASYVLRERAILAARPRWGGSYRTMTAIADEAEDFAQENPRLRVLRGFPPAEVGNSHYVDDEYPDAVRAYGEALAHGESGMFYLGRGKAFYFAKDYGRALDDLNRSASLRPQSTHLLYWRGRTLYRIAERVPLEDRVEILGHAVGELELLNAIDPAYETGAVWLEYAQNLLRACRQGTDRCR